MKFIEKKRKGAVTKRENIEMTEEKEEEEKKSEACNGWRECSNYWFDWDANWS